MFGKFCLNTAAAQELAWGYKHHRHLSTIASLCLGGLNQWQYKNTFWLFPTLDVLEVSESAALSSLCKSADAARCSIIILSGLVSPEKTVPAPKKLSFSFEDPRYDKCEINQSPRRANDTLSLWIAPDTFYV